MLNILLYIWNQKDFELNQICYNPKLSSDFNLDKDLSKEQLVKCKNTELYLQLYISNKGVLVEIIRREWGKHDKVFTPI